MPGRGQHGAARRRAAALSAGAIAFLFQVLAFLWLPAMAPSALVAICTADGMTYRALPADSGQPADEDTHDAAKQGCPLCPVMAGLSVPPPPITGALPAERSRHTATALPGAFVAAGWFLSTLQARAPPATA